MISAERRTSIDAPPARLWAALTDFSRWQELAAVRKFVYKSTPSFRLDPGTAPGPGAVVAMEDESSRVLWRAEEWEAPKSLRLSCEDTESFLSRYHATLSFRLEPQTSLTTSIVMRLEVDFKNPLLKLVMALFKDSFAEPLDAFLHRLKTSI